MLLKVKNVLSVYIIHTSFKLLSQAGAVLIEVMIDSGYIIGKFIILNGVQVKDILNFLRGVYLMSDYLAEICQRLFTGKQAIVYRIRSATAQEKGRQQQLYLQLPGCLL